MKEVVAEQVPKELEKFDKLKNAYDDLNEENAQFVQRNFDLAQENAQLRQENVHLRQLCTEAMRRATHLEINVVGHACHTLHDARRNIRRIEQAPAVPDFTAALAEARDAMRRAETILEEVDDLAESDESEEDDEL